MTSLLEAAIIWGLVIAGSTLAIVGLAILVLPGPEGER